MTPFDALMQAHGMTFTADDETRFTFTHRFGSLTVVIGVHDHSWSWQPGARDVLGALVLDAETLMPIRSLDDFIAYLRLGDSFFGTTKAFDQWSHMKERRDAFCDWLSATDLSVDDVSLALHPRYDD